MYNVNSNLRFSKPVVNYNNENRNNVTWEEIREIMRELLFFVSTFLTERNVVYNSRMWHIWHNEMPKK